MLPWDERVNASKKKMNYRRALQDLLRDFRTIHDVWHAAAPPPLASPSPQTKPPQARFLRAKIYVETRTIRYSDSPLHHHPFRKDGTVAGRRKDEARTIIRVKGRTDDIRPTTTPKETRAVSLLVELSTGDGV